MGAISRNVWYVTIFSIHTRTTHTHTGTQLRMHAHIEIEFLLAAVNLADVPGVKLMGLGAVMVAVSALIKLPPQLKNRSSASEPVVRIASAMSSIVVLFSGNIINEWMLMLTLAARKIADL